LNKFIYAGGLGTRVALRVTVAVVRVSFLTAGVLVHLVVVDTSHLHEMLLTLITVADLHTVTSAVLLVSGCASCVARRTSASGRCVEAFACAQSVVLGNTLNVGTSQAVGVLADIAWFGALAG
jgi:hypothetical protein